MDVAFLKEIYNGYYKSNQVHISDRALNTVCWNNAFNSVPYTEEEMREWRNNTVEVLREMSVDSVLEVACGTGMILLSLLDKSKRYVGMDVAEEGLRYISDHLTESEKSRVVLYAMEANDIAKLKEKDFDLAFINSATQYMGPEETIERYIDMMIDKVKPNGRIFLGDMKSKTYQDLFYRSIENYADPSTVEQKLVDRRKKFDFEFYIDRAYLESYVSKFERVKHVEIRAKRGKFATEMNLYRFDAVLYLDQYEETPATEIDGSNQNVVQIVENVQACGAETVWIRNMKNQLFYEEVLCKYPAHNSEETTIYIADLCDALQEVGYNAYAVPCKTELAISFDVFAYRRQ